MVIFHTYVSLPEGIGFYGDLMVISRVCFVLGGFDVMPLVFHTCSMGSKQLGIVIYVEVIFQFFS